MKNDFARVLIPFLNQIMILPRRISLTTPGVRATVPMLRGVWGAALHTLNRQVYREVFAPADNDGENVPTYVLRPAPPDPADAPAIDWILAGPALRHDAVLMEAWRMATDMGLGKKREKFFLRAIRPLGTDGAVIERSGWETGWRLGSAEWPIKGDPALTPCRLWFPVPLRILRQKKLVENPTLKDISVAIMRRITQFLPAPLEAVFDDLKTLLLEIAESVSSSRWHGERLDIVRYSARQERELCMRGVTGHLDLYHGPGDLWPLLAAAQWLHAGKGSVLGLGQIKIQNL